MHTARQGRLENVSIGQKIGLAQRHPCNALNGVKTGKAGNFRIKAFRRHWGMKRELAR